MFQQSYTKIYLAIRKMTQELILYQHMEMSLTPTLRKVFLHHVKKRINVHHGKLHQMKFIMIGLKNKLIIKMHG